MAGRTSGSRLHIAHVIYQRVPVEKYGGTERAVAWLAREQMRLGHSVTVVARPGSHIPGARMIFANARHELFEKIPEDVDLVNSHEGHPPEGFKWPWLATCQGNGTRVVRGNWNFVSGDHARRYGRETFVYNGMPLDEHYFSERKSNRYLFLSRINRPGKNVTRALKLATANDLELDLAGGARWELLTRSQVRKEGAFFLSFDRRFAFHGMVGGWRKAELFAKARALLFPIRWDEPFGIVIAEALAAGTPVIASPRGSMPELIDPEIGFLCDSDEDFAAAFAGIGAISPRRCREYAAEHFAIEKTTQQYLELYRRILDGETLP